MIKWTKVTEGPQPGGAPPQTTEAVIMGVDAAREAMRRMTYNVVRGMSDNRSFMKQVDGRLKWQERWMNFTFTEQRVRAAEGGCREISKVDVVAPWVPEEKDQWHPDLRQAIYAKAQEKGTFLLHEEQITRDLVLATALRILAESEVFKLPKGNEEKEKTERDDLLAWLKRELEATTEDAAMWQAKKFQEGRYVKPYAREERNRLAQSLATTLGGEVGAALSQAAPSSAQSQEPAPPTRQHQRSKGKGKGRGGYQGASSSSSSVWGGEWWSESRPSWWRERSWRG